MADRLVVVATRNIHDEIADIRGSAEARTEDALAPTGRSMVPIHSARWGPGIVRGTFRVWGFWESTAEPGTRARLIQLRDANRCRFWVWNPDSGETQAQFLARVEQVVPPPPSS